MNASNESMTAEQSRKFRYWETRTIITCIIGYALFYFVRKNLSIAMPYLNEEMGISKADLGLFLTLNGLVYGLSKFINGIWGDRSSARWFLPTGLILCGVCNLFFGLSSAVIVLGVFWVLNGWFQGMGVPPCTRLLTHWVVPERLATKMSLWNTSHSIGAGLAIIFCGYVVSIHWGNIFIDGSMFGQHWRWCFILPSAIAILGGIILAFVMRDTPSSVGLPELKSGNKEADKSKESSAEHKAFLRKKVFLNPVIWTIAVGNFFVYVVRFAVLDWGPTMLKEHIGMDISQAGWSVAAFEIAGLCGMLVAGWVTDRVFAGRAPRTCVICMALTTICMVALYLLPQGTPFIVAIAILMCSGFFIYGPQALVGIAAANIATKRAAATAGGFCGLFGYGSTIVSGWGLGLMAQHTGWGVTLFALVAMAIIGTIIFALAWNAKANGYDD
jgi:OPA family glycerol-3-phosphate transporter-like MFS transporter/OPA family sugar phosphate sensor protein UhpC-like MFS transporter